MSPGPIRALDLLRISLPLVRPFRTALGTTTHKDALLVHVVTDDADGWGECAAEPTPGYAPETLDGARLVIRDHLAPRLFAGHDFDDVRGNPFAKAAVEAALLDATLRAAARSLHASLSATRQCVQAGVAIGITDERECRALAAEYVAAGYGRLKLKIEPGADRAVVAAVRAEVGDAVLLAVDGNGAYSLDDLDALRALDEFGLQCIEQPLAPDALLDHAALASSLNTRVCLDETVTSACVARDALALGACAVVNVKPGRVGGLAEAVRVHEACVGAGSPAIIGGMLETGIGRAVNVALASLDGFTEPGDLSASDRYFADDLTEPFTLEDGCLRVPDGPGIGVAPRAEVLRACTTARETLRPE